MSQSRLNRIVLDIETFGLTPGSVVTSIGAVRIQDGIVGDDSFAINIDPVSCIDHDLKMDAQTVSWWFAQSPEAIAALQIDRKPLPDALAAFANWCLNPDEVWGNGSDFDNAILSAAYKAAGMPTPWHYHANRCYRTIRAFCPEIEFRRIGLHHVGLDDARSEADHLVRCLLHLSLL